MRIYISKAFLTIAILLFFATGSYHLYRIFMADYCITQAKEIEKGKDWNTAIPAYQKAIEYAPCNPEYHFLFGTFYLRFAKAANDESLKEMLFQRAWHELEKARKGSPKDARIYLAMAQALQAMADLQSTLIQSSPNQNAEQYYHTAVSLYPNSTQYRYLFAGYYKKAERTDDALRQLSTMIALDPNTNRYIRSNPFWQVSGIDEAVENGLRQALENRFTRKSAASVLATRLAEKQNWIEAARVYKQTMPEGAFADRTAYYLTMGKYLLRGGKDKEAEGYFLPGVAEAPDPTDRAAVIKSFAGEYKRAGKFETLFVLFKKLKKLYPELIEIDLYRAQVLYERGNYHDALSHIDGVLKRKETAEADYWMALTCEKLEKPYEAETYIKRAIKWEPENALYHHYYAGLLYRAWRFSEALTEADAAVRGSNNRNPWYIDRKAWILYRMKRYEESIETWELAASLKPGHKAFSRNIDMAVKAAGQAL